MLDNEISDRSITPNKGLDLHKIIGIHNNGFSYQVQNVKSQATKYVTLDRISPLSLDELIQLNLDG